MYQSLQLQFYVLLMMGAMDARNLYSNLAVNKYLHTVASCWISSTCECFTFTGIRVFQRRYLGPLQKMEECSYSNRIEVQTSMKSILDEEGRPVLLH